MKTKKQIIIVGSLALALGVVWILLYAFNILLYAENKLQDALYQRPGIVSPDIYVLGIDEESLSDRTGDYMTGGLGPFNTWTREDFAAIINKLNEDPEARPAAIGIDVVFSAHKTPEEDQALAEAAKNNGNVVTASMARFGTDLNEDMTGLVNVIRVYEEPYEELAAVTDIGHISTETDKDNVFRHGIYSLSLPDGNSVDAFSVKLLQKYYDYWEMGEVTKPDLMKGSRFYVPFTGKPGDYYGNANSGTSVIRLLRGEIDPAMFAGGIVMIGPYSYGMMDSYFTPMDATVQMHGVEIHANIVNALMDENFKRYTPRILELLILILGILVCYLCAMRFDLRFTAPAALLLSALYVFGTRLLYDNVGYITTLIYPVGGVLTIYIFSVAVKYILERIEKQKIKSIFQKYVDPKLVDKLIESGEADNNDVGKAKDIAVLFVDVRGFTPMSERLKDSPDTVVRILNEYLELTSRSVFDSGGSVDKFIGDATMALFNGFVPLDDYVYKAVCGAWAIVQGSADLNNDIMEKYGVNVGFGVGVNCGPAVVGNLGPSFRKDFTAIGDTVNTAARLESNAKAGTVLIGPEVYERLKDRIEVEPIGEIPLKGKSIGLMVYRLTGIEKVGRKDQEG